MPLIDFPTIDEGQATYDPVPVGQYLCVVEKVKPRTTKDGDEMWGLGLKILQGQHAGRFVWDNMVFSERALPRVKLICSRLGLDVSRAWDVTIDDVGGRKVNVNVQTEEYTDKEGNIRSRNVVPYDGYEEVEDSDDSVPF